MKRILMLLAVTALMAAMLIASAMPAFADKGGVPHNQAGYGPGIKFCRAFDAEINNKEKIEFEGEKIASVVCFDPDPEVEPEV